jgi:hypothetical protein
VSNALSPKVRLSAPLSPSDLFEVDRSHDLTASWSLGGKYAYRLGQASLDRTQLKFFANTAQLAVVRMDRRFRKNWDAMAEVRMLDLPDIQPVVRWPRSIVAWAAT